MLQRLGNRVAIVGALSLWLGSSAWPQSAAALGPLKLPEGPIAVDPVPQPQAAPELTPTSPPTSPPTELDAPSTELVLESNVPIVPIEAPAPAVFVPSAGLDEPVARSRWASKQLPGAGAADTAGAPVVSGGGTRDALEVGASLAGVIALIYVLRLVIRRARGGSTSARSLSGGRSPSGVASVLARYPVTRGQQVVLLGVGQRILVVHQSAGTMSTLSEITDPEEVADLHAQIAGVDRENVEQRFSSQLSRSLERTPDEGGLQSVAGLPGVVAETIDLTRRGTSRRFSGGAA